MTNSRGSSILWSLIVLTIVGISIGVATSIESTRHKEQRRVKIKSQMDLYFARKMIEMQNKPVKGAIPGKMIDCAETPPPLPEPQQLPACTELPIDINNPLLFLGTGNRNRVPVLTAKCPANTPNCGFIVTNRLTTTTTPPAPLWIVGAIRDPTSGDIVDPLRASNAAPTIRDIDEGTEFFTAWVRYEGTEISIAPQEFGFIIPRNAIGCPTVGFPMLSGFNVNANGTLVPVCTALPSCPSGQYMRGLGSDLTPACSPITAVRIGVNPEVYSEVASCLPNEMITHFNWGNRPEIEYRCGPRLACPYASGCP